VHDKYGFCTTCGNAVVDADEACDTALDSHCYSDCSGCAHPWIALGRRCVLCGNGQRDVIRSAEGDVLSVEVCDAAQPGCAPDCAACQSGFVPSGDATGTCTPECTECCVELIARQGGSSVVSSAGGLVVSITFFLLGFLATL